MEVGRRGGCNCGLVGDMNGMVYGSGSAMIEEREGLWMRLRKSWMTERNEVCEGLLVTRGGEGLVESVTDGLASIF